MQGKSIKSPKTLNLIQHCSRRYLDSNLNQEVFDCGNSELNNFFYSDAKDFANQLLGKTYVFTLDANPKEVVCAFTVANSSIEIKNIPKATGRRIKTKMPRPKHMGQYPAVLVGRIGVNKSFKGQGIGTQLMNFIKGWFIDPNNKTGCRFIVVDAYDNEEAVNYYQKNGFNFFYKTKEEEEKAEGRKINTRYMYYDLFEG